MVKRKATITYIYLKQKVSENTCACWSCCGENCCEGKDCWKGKDCESACVQREDSREVSGVNYNIGQ